MAPGGNPLSRWFGNRKVRSKILIAVGAVALAGLGHGPHRDQPAGHGASGRRPSWSPPTWCRPPPWPTRGSRSRSSGSPSGTSSSMTAPPRKPPCNGWPPPTRRSTRRSPPICRSPLIRTAVRQFQADWAAYKRARDATLVPAARGDDLPAFISAVAAVGPLAGEGGQMIWPSWRAPRPRTGWRPRRTGQDALRERPQRDDPGVEHRHRCSRWAWRCTPPGPSWHRCAGCPTPSTRSPPGTSPPPRACTPGTRSG